MDLGVKSDPNMHRAHSGSIRVRIEARQPWVGLAKVSEKIWRSESRNDLRIANEKRQSGKVGKMDKTIERERTLECPET
jgi:hypothetical protein